MSILKTILQEILMYEVKTHCPNRIIINMNKVLTIGMYSSLDYIGEKLEKVINVQLIGKYK